MKLLFRQRFFSWLDSYDIYDEAGNTVFTVEGKLAFGHCLHILDPGGQHIATVREVVLTFLPKFEMYEGDRMVGRLCRNLTFLTPSYRLEGTAWTVGGDFLEWDYTISDGGRPVATVSKELFHMTDTYSITVENPDMALRALMVVLSIDAEKCSRN